MNPPKPKCLPPVAGSIKWSKSILGRVQRPMAKFIQKSQIMKNSNGKKVLNDFKIFVK